MPATRELDETTALQLRLPDRSSWGIVGQTDIAYRVGKSQQVIACWFRLLFDHEPDHFPTARCREGLSMLLAQIVAMWFRLAGQRTEDRCGVPVGICQGRGGRALAACS
jgi:hypothetical protein